MELEDIIRSHFSYTCADDINKICAPLFSAFPIKYFAYLRKYSDNSVVVLNSSKEWMLNYAQKQYPIPIGSQHIYTWQASMPEIAVYDAATNFGFYNGIMLQKEQNNYIEMIELASSGKGCDPIDFCCNKHLFNQFLWYFKDKTAKIMQKAENERLILPAVIFSKIEETKPAYEKFHSSIKSSKIRLIVNRKEIIFTRREYEVLALLATGKSMKQAALILDISPKTLETYLNRAKIKTQAHSTNQLLENFTANLF